MCDQYIIREIADIINKGTYTLAGKRPEPSDELMDIARKIYDLVSEYDDINRPPAEPEDIDWPTRDRQALMALEELSWNKNPRELIILNDVVTWGELRDTLNWIVPIN